MMNNDLHLAGYMLDPEFAGQDTTTVKGAMRGLLRCADKLMGSGARVAVMKEYQVYKDREGLFAEPTVWEAAREMPAHQWWSSTGAEVENLQFLARLVLSQVQTLR